MKKIRRQVITNKTKFAIPILLLSLALVFTCCVQDVSAAPGDTMYVNGSSGNDTSDGYSWLTAKLSIKNATGTVNENGVVNIADGTYTEENNTNITIDKNMTIKGQSKENTIINGTNTAQIFNITLIKNVKIQDLTLTNGKANNDGGGAIWNGGILTVNNCNFQNNAVSSYYEGGAIYNIGTLIVNNSAFTNNTASYTDGGVGGAIYNTGTLTVNNTSFTNNSAYYGGAIDNFNGNSTITNSNFTNNNAIFGVSLLACIGGAIYNTGTLNVNECVFTSNIAKYTAIGYSPYSPSGGAIGNIHGTLNITNSTFTGNQAPNGNGGAIYNGNSTLNVTDSTFTNNVATFGGAICNSSTLNVTESNFTNNGAGWGGAIYNFASTDVKIQFNRIIGNTAPLGSAICCPTGSMNATLNWWGSNTSPVGISTETYGIVLFDPWLILSINADPKTINTGGTSQITADLLHDNGILSDLTHPELYYHDPASGHVPDGIPVTFTTTLGSINSSASIVNGIAQSTLNGGLVVGVANISATIDNQTVNNSVTVVDTLPPTVKSIDPANNAFINVISKVITVTFSEPVKVGNGYIELKNSSGTAVPFTKTISGNTLTITPTGLLSSGIKYTVIVHTGSVTDLAGNPVALYSSSFTVDTIPPTVKSIDPTNNAVNIPVNKLVTVTFSEPVKIGNGYIELKNSSGTAIPFTKTISGNMLTITPTNPLSNGVKYTVIIHTGSVIDLAGNPVALYSSSFTTSTT